MTVVLYELIDPCAESPIASYDCDFWYLKKSFYTYKIYICKVIIGTLLSRVRSMTVVGQPFENV